jgi:Cys-tRNA(Pro)/Cys-tRNA(Cys) deacylase
VAATPAIEVLEKAGVSYQLHTYDHDPSAASYGLEVATALGVVGGAVLKTLIADLGSELVVAVVPVRSELDLRALAQHLGTKRAALAKPSDAERSSGYVLGGISPLGQRRQLKTVIDESVARLSVCFVSPGRRGFEVELAPRDLAALTNATFAGIQRPQ